MLKDKVIVLIGGAGLLGREFCIAVVQESGTAIVADRDGPAAKQLADQIAVDGPGNAESISIDITDRESIQAVIASVSEKYGRIDAVVNSAYPRNSNYGRVMEAVTYSDFCENVGMHLGGYFLVAQQFAEFFRARGGGHIVNVASIYGSIVPRFEIYESTNMTMPVEYAVIKSALIHLTKYMAKYLKGTSVRCNTLSPGGVFNNQPESFVEAYREHCSSKGLLDTRDLRGALIFLLSDAAARVNGQDLVVDDGFSL